MESLHGHKNPVSRGTPSQALERNVKRLLPQKAQPHQGLSFVCAQPMRFNRHSIGLKSALSLSIRCRRVMTRQTLDLSSLHPLGLRTGVLVDGVEGVLRGAKV